ncbi:hypothetical protein IPN41_02985 [Candidatus Falkowbacteria bacterium]|nr:MAG: hypothetical protein IPN41_02985 [Candidatus Falkowbacteria bacterium]
MTISLDFSGIQELLSLPMEVALWRVFFWYFGWLPIAIVMLWGLLQYWLFERRGAWEHKQKFILLAIDVPRNNTQSLMAVENMITYFAGGHGSFSLIEKWWDGKFQLGFSLEIISIGGYIQFLIHTPAHFRNFVETGVYSQYPDAEIYEVEDYTKIAPNVFPDEDYDIWGSEIVQVTNQALPIKTYPQFEHDFGEKETKFRDPMTSLMDLMSSLRKGEQLWYQIILVPTGTAWTKEAKEFIDEKLGRSKHVSKSNELVDRFIQWLGDFSEVVYKLWGDVDDKKSEKSKALSFMEMDPMQKAQIEAVHKKMIKMGFEVCIRMIYLSRKEVMNKPKVVNGFVGYIKQFNTNDLNALKPDTKMTMTSASYFFTKSRINQKKNSIMRGYKSRSEMIGRAPWILNVEELATLWHFPLDAVTKAPLIQRSQGRRIEPPMSLPFEESRKQVGHLDPIFDPGFKIVDDNELSDKSNDIHEEKSTTAKPNSGRPGFFDDDETEVTEAVEEKSIEEISPEPVDNSHETKTPKQPGVVPDNLPFG